MRLLLTLGSLCFALSLSACSNNILGWVDSKDPAEQAAAYLDQGQADDAIDVLESALQDEPSNWTYVSLLASAKAQKAGVDTTSIAIRLAERSASGGESSSGLLALFTALPEANLATLKLMSEAVDLMSSIPTGSLLNADTFKSSLFNVSYSALQIRFYDADGNGTLSVDELLQMDDKAATGILSSLANAILATAGASGETSAASAEAIASIRAEIDSQPGATDAEKLRNYLNSKGGAATAGIVSGM